MDAHGFLETLGAREGRSDSLAYVRTLPEIPVRTVPFPEHLPRILVERLGLLGITGLYRHQSEALSLLRDRRDVIVATGTASGKTLVGNLAFAAEVVGGAKATALYLMPTKALARDQLRQVRALRLPDIRAAVYDGDTPRPERPLIRRNANLVLTNPDMMHASILPDHQRWADFMLRLSLVVVDEAHVARGVFGSHIAMILRRLRRLVAHYGGDPSFLLASATIGNPSDLAEGLVGRHVAAVTEDSTPRGRKLFALWNPPLLDEETGERRSALSEAADLVADLAQSGVRSIGFTRSRRAAELLAQFARHGAPPDVRGRIKAYRAGYLPEERRALERALSAGELLAVASTNALELGIDIGSLEAAVLVGYPGTRASMWQQAGRAGRRSEDSLAVLVAQDDPLDQYLAANPSDLFDRAAEDVVIDPANGYVVGPHIACAARELPLPLGDLERYFGAAGAAAVHDMIEDGELAKRGETLYHRGREAPHGRVDIRSTSGRVFRIVIGATGELLGTVDEARAHAQVHPGAVYLHQGEQFLVAELDLGRRVAVVDRADPDYYTQARDTTDIRVVRALREGRTGDAAASFGIVHVSNQVVGYARTLIATGETVEIVPLAFPPQTLETRAVWWSVDDRIIDRAAVGPAGLPGAAHAAEHAAIGLLPLVATCDRWDVGGVSTAMHPDTGTCAIFIYDGYAGGAGIAERAFESAERLLKATLETVRRCPCSHGCPSCVQSPKCGNGNEPLDKPGAVALLAAALGETWG